MPPSRQGGIQQNYLTGAWSAGAPSWPSAFSAPSRRGFFSERLRELPVPLVGRFQERRLRTVPGLLGRGGRGRRLLGYFRSRRRRFAARLALAALVFVIAPIVPVRAITVTSTTALIARTRLLVLVTAIGRGLFGTLARRLIGLLFLRILWPVGLRLAFSALRIAPLFANRGRAGDTCRRPSARCPGPSLRGRCSRTPG